jgi:hypothetical protein
MICLLQKNLRFKEVRWFALRPKCQQSEQVRANEVEFEEMLQAGRTSCVQSRLFLLSDLNSYIFQLSHVRAQLESLIFDCNWLSLLLLFLTDREIDLQLVENASLTDRIWKGLNSKLNDEEEEDSAEEI